MKRIALVLVLAGCTWGPLAPAEFWCSQTHHFTTPDTLVSPPPWNLEPDSVTTTWSVNGECPE